MHLHLLTLLVVLRRTLSLLRSVILPVINEFFLFIPLVNTLGILTSVPYVKAVTAGSMLHVVASPRHVALLPSQASNSGDASRITGWVQSYTAALHSPSSVSLSTIPLCMIDWTVHRANSLSLFKSPNTSTSLRKLMNYHY